mmetsp:Transcript_116962/g.268421  ORF Transcript_116962/g.268421 Transcript_116962/m.268421 type:complete len:246 (+) Transcript_116962:283-1020(+)
MLGWQQTRSATHLVCSPSGFLVLTTLKPQASEVLPKCGLGKEGPLMCRRKSVKLLGHSSADETAGAQSYEVYCDDGWRCLCGLMGCSATRSCWTTMLRVSYRVLGRGDVSRLFYPYFVSTPLRLSDNDGFMHVNNAVYYSCFDTASVLFMERECPGEFGVHAALKPFIAASSCEFLRPMVVPQILSVDTGVSIIKVSCVGLLLVSCRVPLARVALWPERQASSLMVVGSSPGLGNHHKWLVLEDT